jgi:hypothetical protein
MLYYLFTFVMSIGGGHMLNPMPKDLCELMAATQARFRSNPQLTLWDAAEQVLNEIPLATLARIYRRASRMYGWCRKALSEGDEALVPAGVEEIGLMLRLEPHLRQEDDRRSRGSIKPGRAPSRRRRPPR